jgi:hypothetical protein
MTKGEKVSIYYDPFTEQKLEGEAVLLEKIEEDELFETWAVRFKGDGEKDISSRMILKPNR